MPGLRAMGSSSSKPFFGLCIESATKMQSFLGYVFTIINKSNILLHVVVIVSQYYTSCVQ